MRKLWVCVLCLIVISVSGCLPFSSVLDDTGDNPGLNQLNTGASSDKVVLEVTESGYSVTTNSLGSTYVYYGFILKNPDAKSLVEYATVRITLKAADGSVIASENDMLSNIRPGQSCASASRVETKGQAVESVVFEALDASGYDIASAENYPAPLTVEGAKRNEGSYSTSFTGEINNPNGQTASSANITILYRSGGKIVGGDTGYVNGVRGSSKTPFDVSGYSSKDIEYDTFDVYVQDGRWE